MDFVNNQLEQSGKRFCMIYKTSFGGGYSICSFSSDLSISAVLASLLSDANGKRLE